jgi:hypothetical protein
MGNNGSLNSFDIAQKTIENMIARRFGVKHIETVSRGRMIRTIAKMDRDNSYLLKELYCLCPGHQYFLNLEQADRDVLESLRVAREADEKQKERGPWCIRRLVERWCSAAASMGRTSGT